MDTSCSEESALLAPLAGGNRGWWSRWVSLAAACLALRPSPAASQPDLTASEAPEATPGITMLDVGLDDPAKPWCYLAKSTTVIGVPFQPDVTQVTFDGALYTRSAELCFFYGQPMQPLLARQKNFLEGWLPVVQYAWTDGPVSYDIEMFAAALEGESADNTVNFVRLRARNTGRAPATAVLGAMMRDSAGDYRLGRPPFDAGWRYEMSEQAAFRGDALVYAFSGPAEREAVPGVAYAGPFAGRQYALTARSEVCVTKRRRELAPGETSVMTFKMPRVPVPRANESFLKKLAQADYQEYRDETVAWWKNWLASGAVFEFPEKCVQEAQRASLVHVLLATRTRNGRHFQTDGLPYPEFFLTSVPEMAMTYLGSGQPEYATKLLVPGAIAQQQADGLYFDRAVSQGRIIPATQGHILYAVAQSVLFTWDKAFAESVYPSLQKGVGFIAHSIKSDPYGLLPRCWPYDAEMIDGHYTGQNMFALMGLRYAVRVARFLDQREDAAAWTALAKQYEANVLKGIAASATPDGYVPTGLYKYLIGKTSSRPYFADYQYNSDWENMLLAYPTEALPPQDPRVKGTVDHVRQGYAEGIMTYRHGQHLHQYITANQVEQYMAMGDTYTALKDFYHILLHAGPTYECFENLVRPWTDRHVEAGCPPPHAWAAAKLGALIRDLVLLEYGGKDGLEPGQRELWLFHCLSPAWTKPGDTIRFQNAPTEFGPISATFSNGIDGASISLAAQFHTQPADYRIRVPYFKELLSFTTDARQKSVQDNCILLSPDATWVTLKWKDKPGAHVGAFEDLLTEYRKANSFEGVDKNGAAIIKKHVPFLLPGERRTEPQPLSFALVRDTFEYEYARRASASLRNGGKLLRVQAPAIQSPATAAAGGAE